MKYKFFVFAPKDDKVINSIINAASNAGAGDIGNYSHCAFIQEGKGNYIPEEGADLYIGKVGKISREDEVLIQMECSSDDVRKVSDAVKEVHPYEEVVIDFVKLEEV